MHLIWYDRSHSVLKTVNTIVVKGMWAQLSFFPECLLPGMRRQVKSYYPAGTAAVGARNICSSFFTLREEPSRSAEVCSPIKTSEPLRKSLLMSLQKVLTMISWPKSSGSAGVSWSSVFFFSVFFFWSQTSLINRPVSDLDFHNKYPSRVSH